MNWVLCYVDKLLGGFKTALLFSFCMVLQAGIGSAGMFVTITTFSLYLISPHTLWDIN